jgi:DNA-binding NarL/FixJ family response regulator
MKTAGRILLIDDQKRLRESIKTFIQDELGAEVVSESVAGPRIIALCRKYEPEVVLMDVHFLGVSVMDVIKQIRRELPETKILALSLYCTGRIVEGVIRAGVSGFVVKTNLYDELLPALKSVMAGGHYFSHGLTAKNTDQTNCI